MQIIDLTLPLYTGMPVFPGDPEVSIKQIQTIEKEGWNMLRLEINGHDGTHVNAPLHMAAGGKSLDDYSLEDFCGDAEIYDPGIDMTPEKGYLFRDQNIDDSMADRIIEVRPRFIGLSSAFEFDIAIEKVLLEADILSYERLANLDRLPHAFKFFGMPLNIRGGDGSPVAPSQQSHEPR